VVGGGKSGDHLSARDRASSKASPEIVLPVLLELPIKQLFPMQQVS
jgi:hypothetical protein